MDACVCATTNVWMWREGRVVTWAGGTGHHKVAARRLPKYL